MVMTRHLAGCALAVVAVLAATCPAPAAEDPFVTKFVDGPDRYWELAQDGRPVVRFVVAYDASTPARRTETYKPFLHVYDAQGKGFITNGAHGKQYPHHRGIFIGWMKLLFEGKRYDFWGMGGGDQVYRKPLADVRQPESVLQASLIDWNTRQAQTLIEEERTHTIYKQSLPTLALIDFTSRLTPVAGDVVLDGDPEHAGVQYRPHDGVDRKTTRYLFHAQGIDPLKDKDLPWVALQYTLDGQTYSVQHMSHPDNPKGSVWSAYRDYGRFGPWFKKELKKGETLALRYRFWVTQGEPKPRDVYQTQWDAFAKSAAPRSYK